MNQWDLDETQKEMLTLNTFYTSEQLKLLNEGTLHTKGKKNK